MIDTIRACFIRNVKKMRLSVIEQAKRIVKENKT